jgi:predicted heme/steroid binding protein
MDLENNIKRMYGYFTEVNKKVYLIQWQYRNSPVMGRRYEPPAENTTIPTEENTQIVPGENAEVIPENRIFTLEELSQYNGSNNNPAYMAVDGVVYDVSKIPVWAGGSHFGIRAGTDGTQDYRQCHGATGVVERLPKVGILQR